MRLAPTERQRVFILTILVGVVCGLAAVAFHLAIRFGESMLINRAMSAGGDSWVWWTLVTPTVGGLMGGALLQYVVPEARGSGIPQVKVAYVVKGGRLPFRVAVGKFIIGAIQIGSGASLGREGPTVQICAGVASALGRLAALKQQNLKRLLPVGAAAGIAAAFNAPLAAVTFTVEEVVGDLDQTVLSGVVVAAALAAVIERSILGEHPVFDIPQNYGLHHASSLLLYAALGVAAALVSVLFTDCLLKLRRRFQRLKVIPAWMHPGIGGFVTGLLAIVGLVWLKEGGVTGGGYETLGLALTGTLTLKVLLVLCLLKLAATVFSYSSGGAGGIFAPALFIGAMLGGSFGFLDVRLLDHTSNELGAFALVGMGAVFAGIIRAPMTSVLIIFEMTGGYGLVLPLMIANMTAYGLARRLRPTPIYEALLEDDGVHLPHHKETISHALERLRVADAMTTAEGVVTLSAEMSVGETIIKVGESNIPAYPVADVRGRFVGSVTEARLRRTLAEGGGSTKLGQIAQKTWYISADQTLLRAVVRMNKLETRHLAVLEPSGGGRLVGVVSMSDVMRAQARAALAAGDVHLTETGEMSSSLMGKTNYSGD